MHLRTLLTIAFALALAGCSVVAYTPVMIAAAAGQTRVSLQDNPEYAPYFDRRLTLQPVGKGQWSLQKFSEGRYFIALTPEPASNSLFVCDLNGAQITIEDVFEDRINGGVFYSAIAPHCLSEEQEVVETPRNTFSLDVFQDLLQQST